MKIVEWKFYLIQNKAIIIEIMKKTPQFQILACEFEELLHVLKVSPMLLRNWK